MTPDLTGKVTTLVDKAEYDRLLEFIEDLAGMDCISYCKHLNPHPCGVCVSCRARATLSNEGEPNV